ncbi:peptidylprolyl isomerase, partial [Streptococcus danieliae]|nr:peptidylprolyl isomerase [Streptococcus danieliae]
MSTEHERKSTMKKLLIAGLLASAATLALIIYQNQPKQELSLNAQLQEVLKNPETNFPQLQAKVGKKEPVVTLKTSQGDITLKLFPEYAPLAVENFLTHAKEGYYNGLSFHRSE